MSLQFLIIILSSLQRLCASFRATAVLRLFEMQFNLISCVCNVFRTLSRPTMYLGLSIVG